MNYVDRKTWSEEKPCLVCEHAIKGTFVMVPGNCIAAECPDYVQWFNTMPNPAPHRMKYKVLSVA